MAAFWMHVLWMLVSVDVCFGFWSFRSHKSCELDVNWNLIHQNAPVFLRRSIHGYELASPDEVITIRNYFVGSHRTGVLRIPYGDEIYAACPGYGNTLYGLQQPAQFATYNCLYRRNILRMDKQMFKSHLVRCTQPVTTLVRETGRDCGNGQAKEYEVGYSITPESNPSARDPQTYGLMWMKMDQPDAKRAVQEGQSSFYRVLSCCYDPTTVRTLYSVHTLQGDKIAGAETRRAKPPYLVGQASLYPPGFDVHSLYKYPNQKKLLQRLLGRRQADEVLSKTFLARGHLASAQDFLMGNWQASSCIYLNLVPQWQSINRGHWYRVEKKLRRLADITKTTLLIATGTYGVMKIVDDNNVTKELYLDPDRKLLAVPDLMWKVVSSPKNNSCIAFVMSNNPWEEGPLQPLCRDICHEHSWPEDYIYEWRGRMYCCTVEDLKAVVDYVPEFHCSSVLDYIPEEPRRTVPFNLWFRGKSRFL